MKSWKKELQQAVSDPDELCLLLELPVQSFSYPKKHFPLRVPRPFIGRMKKNDLHDPLLLQVLTTPAEFDPVEGYTIDPLQEANCNPLPGLLHKYQGRVLIVLSGSCAINCRYCFRRSFAYHENNALKHWSKILEYIRQDASIVEVIFSGGDPLLIDDDYFARLLQDLESIAHVTTLRIHTRLPVVIPSRVTETWVQMLLCSRLHIVTVLHVNHANEIDAELASALRLLKPASHILNQTVLLKRVNDSADVLEQLSRRLFSVGILPYYLHQLDSVSGAHHFYVPKIRGLELMRQLQARLPGYLVPRYVEELPGEPHKMPI